MTMETPLARVRGLGSAREGGHHWWIERLTSVSTLLLFIWLLVSLLRLPAVDYRTVNEWLESPLAAVPMLLLILSTFWHLKLGMQVVIEDYVHVRWLEVTLQVLVTLACALAALASLYALIHIAVTTATYYR